MAYYMTSTRDSVSIHAPVKGATGLGQAKPIGLFGFNPRSREGSDNIYAGRPGSRACFNPRSREGSDHAQRLHFRFPVRFNPRSREGSDAIKCVIVIVMSVSIHAPVKGATSAVRRGSGT